MPDNNKDLYNKILKESKPPLYDSFIKSKNKDNIPDSMLDLPGRDKLFSNINDIADQSKKQVDDAQKQAYSSQRFNIAMLIVTSLTLLVSIAGLLVAIFHS